MNILRIDLDRQITELEQALLVPLPPAVRQLTIASLDDLRSKRATLDTPIQPDASEQKMKVGGDIVGSDKVAGDKIAGNKLVKSQGNISVSDDARFDGVAVGVNLGRIIYGRDPQEDEQRQLVWYLSCLAAKLHRLPLRGLEQQLDQSDGLALPQVYVMLTTMNRVEVFRGGNTNKKFHRFYENNDIFQSLRQNYSPDYALPDNAIIAVESINPREKGHLKRNSLSPVHVLYRASLAIEMVVRHPRLVLLGDPGSGKSTFINHLAWTLAFKSIRPLDNTAALVGWSEQRSMLPIILPLRTLAGRIAKDGQYETTVLSALRSEIERYGVQRVDNLLNESLHRGAALLLFDGLDEVPIDSTPNVANRSITLQVVRAFIQLYPELKSVITCRTNAFDLDLRNMLGWPVETIAPFTLGQVRHFIPAWYNELFVKGQISHDQGRQLAQILIDTIVESPKLRAMSQTPLLLTMMTLVLYNKGELPRDRPVLYERILELLLGQWDKVRNGESLAEAIGLPDWGSERVRPLLDKLSYEAFAGATSEDGRGRLTRGTVYMALIDYFKTARIPHPGDVALRYLDYIEQRSGLLLPDGNDSYVFAHLTLQEHSVGRHIAFNSEDPSALIMRHRTNDWWREPIMLGVGLVRPAELNNILNNLIDHEEDGHTKSIDRWYRDLILAAEIGLDRDWNYLRTQSIVKVDTFHRHLRQGLVKLLQDRRQQLSIAERIRAGFLLGGLGDPRYPVTLDDWQREIEQAVAGNITGYFCKIPKGYYIIGSSHLDSTARSEEQPQHRIYINHPLLIARYPITNAQWQTWVQAGGTQSWYADNPDFNGANQPVTGESWFHINGFCAWLSKQLNITIRIPTEYEWEAAARGGDARLYPWGDTWCEDYAATSEDQNIRGWPWPVPVGCYPAGKSQCGALDMAGNVWEWTANEWSSYPGARRTFNEPNLRMLRGGDQAHSKASARCAARGWNPPSSDHVVVSLRLIVETPYLD